MRNQYHYNSIITCNRYVIDLRSRNVLNHCSIISFHYEFKDFRGRINLIQSITFNVAYDIQQRNKKNNLLDEPSHHIENDSLLVQIQSSPVVMQSEDCGCSTNF